MQRFDPSPIIKNSNLITDIFGYWPSFHDAEVQSISLTGGEVDPSEPGCESPMLDIKIHLWEMTNKVDAKGFFVLEKHTLTVLRFQNTGELELSNFCCQNAIMEMIFNVEPEHTDPISGRKHQAWIRVEIDPCCGLYAKFKCQFVEVFSAVPCDEEGTII